MNARNELKAAVVSIRAVVVVILAAVAIAKLGGCAEGTEFGIGAPTNTPDYYPENKPFYLEDLKAADQHTAAARGLKHLYEFDPAPAANKAFVIEDGSPLAVIASGVRVPDDLPGGRHDLAVVLDVATSASGEAQSMVVFYQRDVPPGQMLNFQNLVVYYDPQWDSTTPPYFRLRLIDVRAERNTRMQEMLDKVSSLGAAVNGLIPHPIMPIVTTAIEAAKLVLGNQKDRTVLDYQVQFYSLKQTAASGGSDMGILRAGTWLVVGRPRQELPPPRESRPYPEPSDGALAPKDGWFPADVWREEIGVDRRTGQLLRVADGMVIQAPYVSVIVTKADAQVPKFVMDRSAELVKLLSSPAGKADTAALESSAAALMQSVTAFTLKRRVQRDKNIADLAEVVTMLDRDREAQAGNQARLLNDTQVREMMRFVDRVVNLRDRQFTTVDELVKWWKETGQNGRLAGDESAENGMGVRWVQ